ncbi:MAG: hypothetical protein WBB94_03040 [Candidatus Saccharimonadaceae bacterium]
MSIRVMDKPPVLYERNEYGGGTVSPADVIRDQELMIAREILSALGTNAAFLDEIGYLLKGPVNNERRQFDADANKDPWDADA